MTIRITQYNDVLIKTSLENSIETHMLEVVINKVEAYKYDKTSKRLTVYMECKHYEYNHVIKVEIL